MDGPSKIPKQRRGLHARRDDTANLNAVHNVESLDPDDWEEYEVESILAERPDPEKSGKLQLLIKWVALPLALATWEPQENLQHLSHVWNTEKALVKAGKKKAFDVQEYYRAFVKWNRENERKHHDKYGHLREPGGDSATTSDDDDDDEAAEPIQSPSPLPPPPPPPPTTISRDKTKSDTGLKATAHLDMHYTISKDRTGAGGMDHAALVFREWGERAGGGPFTIRSRSRMP